MEQVPPVGKSTEAPEKKSIFAKAAEKAKSFLNNLNPIGKDKTWFGGVVVGAAETLLLAPLAPFPVSNWIKSGINALLFTGLWAGVNKFYDWREKRIRRGTSKETVGHILENSQRRAKAAQRVKSFFGGLAAGTIVGLGVEAAGAAIPSAGEALQSGREAVYAGASNAATTASEAVSNIPETAGSIAAGAGEAVGNASDTMREQFANAATLLGQGVERATVGAQAITNAGEYVANQGIDTAGPAIGTASDYLKEQLSNPNTMAGVAGGVGLGAAGATAASRISNSGNNKGGGYRK